jgi:putative transposase
VAERHNCFQLTDVQAESFMKTLKVEDIDPAGYETFADVAE